MPSVSDTKVLLSFGAAEGGFEFAMQLRLDICKKFGRNAEVDPYFCYLDAESLRTNPKTKYTYDPKTDTNRMSNSEWLKNYQSAMDRCKTMVLLITKEWMTSKWCWLEMDMLITQAEKSKKKIAVIYWPDSVTLMKEASWKERQEGNARTPKDLYDRIEKIQGDKFVTTTCGFQDPIKAKVPGSDPKTDPNVYAYSCTEQECNHILAMIDA